MAKHILIVDDQPDNITLLVEVLRDEYDLSAAIDGESALQRAVEEPPPDLILLDVMMPGMDGYEVCRRLKSDEATADIPIIFITAMTDPEDEARGLALGASDYITKPFSPPVVKARVWTHLQLSEAMHLLEDQNEVLEDRVRKRSAEVIQAQRERAESLNHFADAMAHQIRNPVMSIGGMAGLLVRKAPGDLAEYAEAVREGGLRLESLVREISEYVALAAGGRQVISIKSLMEQAMTKARGIAEASGYALRYTVDMQPAMVGVDARIVVAAVVEIVVNAMEFSRTGETELVIRGGMGLGQDELRPEGPHEDGTWYGIEIIDDGPGISKDNLTYVTDPFFTTKPQGVGMGLTKVKRVICDEHGGALLIRSPISLDDAQSPGTSVTFDLPPD